MKKAAGHPRLLPEVLQAIADLRDGHGSNTRKIMEQVESNKRKTGKPRNLTMEVRRALRHALDEGIVKERAGRYRLGTEASAKQTIDPYKGCDDCRRRRRRGSHRRRRRRGRRHAVEDDQSVATASEWDSEATAETEDDTTGPEPLEARRRRRHRKGGRRRRRRRSHSSHTEVPPSERLEGGHDGADSFDKAADLPDCDNPECACNLKQEPTEDQQDLDQPHGNYIN